MTRDVGSALHDLAAAAEAATPADTIDVGAVRTRARRRRRTRTAALVAGSTAAAVVVAAGAALAVRPDRTAPVPALTPTQTSRPTPTPSPPPVTLPTGDASLPFGACGSLAPRDAAPTAFTPNVSVATPTVPAGSLLDLTSWVDVSDEGAYTDADTPHVVHSATYVSLVPGAGPDVAVVRDGVVVGTFDPTGGQDVEPEPYLAFGESSPTFHLVQLELSVCGAQDGVPSPPLPAGHYELVPWADVVALGDDSSVLWDEQGADVDADVLRALPSAEPRTVVGAPVGFDITGRATTSQHVVWPEPVLVDEDSPWPACGDPGPTRAPTAPAMLRLATSLTATSVPVGAPVDSTGELTYDGPDRLAAGVSWVIGYLVVQGGVVVGDSIVPEDGWMRGVDFWHGTSLPMAGSAALQRCSDGPGEPGDALPPGTYTVYPYVGLTSAHLARDTVSDRTPVSRTVLGDPVDVTVTAP